MHITNSCGYSQKHSAALIDSRENFLRAMPIFVRMKLYFPSSCHFFDGLIDRPHVLSLRTNLFVFFSKMEIDLYEAVKEIRIHPPAAVGYP